MTENSELAQLRAQIDLQNAANTARAQLHRWFAFYERDPKNWDNQFDLLSDDIEIIRGVGPEGGIETGKDNYRTSVEAFPVGEGHAHHIKRFQILPIGTTGQWLASIDLHYSNRSVNGDERAGALHYAMQLDYSTPALPTMRRVIVELDHFIDEPFQDAYPLNRAASLVYYWLTLIESRNPDPAPLTEILAKDASFHLSDGRTLNGAEAIADWFTGLPSLVQASHHDVHNLTVHPQETGHLTLSMDLDWQGIDTDGRPVTARTHHDWTLTDGNGRFPQLQQATITQTQPITTTH
ncbi:nuclear transport factor 2 family protein [Streptomyces sp. NPDC002835]